MRERQRWEIKLEEWCRSDQFSDVGPHARRQCPNLPDHAFHHSFGASPRIYVHLIIILFSILMDSCMKY